MPEMIPIVEYRKRRPKMQSVLNPLNKILNKLTRDWAFGWRLRLKLYRIMGVQIAQDDHEIFIGRENWIDDNFPELVRFDEGVATGWRCVFLVHNACMMPPSVGPIVIGKKAILGVGVTVMPGVTIGEYAQVGACALVTKDVEPYMVVAGVPAKPIRKINEDEIALRNIPVKELGDYLKKRQILNEDGTFQ